MTSLRHPPVHLADGQRGDDDVILLDEHGEAIGRAPRLAVHTDQTPLHRAFSCHIFDDRGRVLITRRALGKVAWPGVWTNACCGHPRPGEDDQDAVRRRVGEELGAQVREVTPVLPDFRYRAVDASGIVEHEVCPVYVARLEGDVLHPDPDEVMDWTWVSWEDLAAAVAATPHVYSPWSVLQVDQIGRRSPWPAASTGSGLEDFLAAVEDELARLVAELQDLWLAAADGLRQDVLDDDLPHWLSARLLGQGKRFRATMTWWGYVAAGGSGRGNGLEAAVRAAAALETLHLFGLVHDDVMDESPLRRGGPAAHVVAARRHAAAGGRGSSAAFGNNIAVLLGDLAHMLADRIAATLPTPMVHAWYRMCTELMVGQCADLTGAAAGRRDLDHAERVARLKSGRYTIDRPLELGALAAGADDRSLAVLARYGRHLGTVFALRDDVLGVWGDPEVTGKPSSDDLVEGKATVLLSLAEQSLLGQDAALLSQVGSGRFTAPDAARLASAMTRAGVRDRVEAIIVEEHSRAVAELGDPLTPEGVAGLRRAADLIAWRQR